MVFLRHKVYATLVTEAAQARALAARVVAVEARNEKLLDAILALKAVGAELPPGFGEEGWGRYVMDEVETREPDTEALRPDPSLPPEEDQEVLNDIARALGFKP